MTIYAKTEAGQRAFDTRSPVLSARQRAVFILLDGRRSARQVLETTAGLGVTQEDFQHLLDQGFVREASAVPASAAAAAAIPAQAAPAADAAQRYLLAYPIATRLTASLGLRGFRLNMAVESARGYEELLALLPRIRDAVGAERCRPLEQALSA